MVNATKWTFRHYWQANMTNRQSTLHDDVIKGMKDRLAWRQKGSVPLEHCAACNPKWSLWWGTDEKYTFEATKSRRNGSRLMWIERSLWEQSELKTQRQQLGRSRKIWEMVKRQDWQPESLNHHLRRCSTPSEILCAILHIPKMGTMGNTRMMMRKILSWARWSRMTNPAGWWALSLKSPSIAWSVFGRCWWSLMNWRN